MEIKEVILSHAQAKNGVLFENDSLGVGAFCQKSGVLKAFVSNPYIANENEELMVFELVDNVVMGREIFYPTRMKMGDSIINSCASSSLLVAEEGRKYMLGASLVMHQINNKSNTVLLYGGMTEMAVDLYKRLKFVIFDIPTIWQVRNTTPILQNFNFSGIILNLASYICNMPVKLYSWFSSLYCYASTNKYKVRELTEAPDWIEEIVRNDSHKYAEFHGKEWFNWALQNCFSEDKSSRQALYGIYMGEKPKGFVLLTERSTSVEDRNIDKVVFGTVREWGTNDEISLGEKDIFKIALNCFSKNVDIVTISTSDDVVRKKMQKYGFLKHGNYNIAFRPLGIKLDEDSKDANNWRIRPSYSDTCFY